MTNPWTKSGTAASFDADVIQPSHQNPVLVDFWAEWCAPCRALAPVIDELVERLAGALLVVKIDTDAEQALAGEYGIRSLPTLVVFRDGKPVTQAIGAQPLSALEALVRPYLSAPMDADLAEVMAAIEASNHAGAAQALEAALAKDDTDYRLHPLLASCYIVLERFDDARAIISSLPANIGINADVQQVVARLNLATSADFAGDDDISDAYRGAVKIAVNGDFDSAVAALIALLGKQRGWQEGKIRKTLLDIFKILGDDPRLKGWRTAMARVLN